MRIRHHAQGKFYTIGCPEGTTVFRRPGPHDLLLVPFEGQTLRIPADPHELLPLLAESGRFGLSLAGEPEADEWLAGATCPECGEADVAWLQADEDSESVHCDRCGADFARPVPADPGAAVARRADG